MRLLVTVKTYPTPSASYEELVCTAGVLPGAGFVRIYPVQFRQLPYDKQYQKYEWVQLEASPNPKDPRPDSFRPVQDTIKPEGEVAGTEDGWAARKRLILPHASRSLEQLRKKREAGGPSLGIFRPKKVLDFDWEELPERSWTEAERERLTRRNLFGPKLTPLEKIPYRFRYRFRCDAPSCRGNHHISIIDWEVGRLFLRMREQCRETEALDKVRETFLGRLCGPDVETYFYMGTSHLPYEAWLILGVFYPPIQQQMSLEF
jgi:hypothetical protein